MSAVFLQKDALSLLRNKYILILGDSIQRSLYKDLISLLEGGDTYTQEDDLRIKGEDSFYGDQLIEGGIHCGLTNGINYREFRQYYRPHYLIRFLFVTRCYNEYIQSIIDSVESYPHPDIVIMNSCLWDLSRYNDDDCSMYRSNIQTLFSKMARALPIDTMFIWNTSLPVSHRAHGGVLHDIFDVRQKLELEANIIEANYFAQAVAKEYSFDCIDLHYFLRHQIHLRVKDGIHWNVRAHRRITNLLLTHIAEAFQFPLPTRVPTTSYFNWELKTVSPQMMTETNNNIKDNENVQ